MATATSAKWKQGSDLEYLMPMSGGNILAILLPAGWLKADRSGQPLLLPPAVRALDRLRALFVSKTALTPGFIVSLREAMGMTQQELARKLGVSKMTVSRWERGTMQPSEAAANSIHRLQRQAQRQGVRIDGAKRASRHRSLSHLS